MDNYSGIRLGATMEQYLSTLEAQFGIPLRLIDAGGRAVVPDRPAQDRIVDELGYSTTILNDVEGGFRWRPERHPDGIDMSDGVSILFRGTSQPHMQARNATDLIAEGGVRNRTFTRNLLDRISHLGDTFLVPFEDSEPMDWVLDYQAIPLGDWGVEDPPAPPFAELFRLADIPGRMIAYPFRANRMQTGEIENGRLPREQLFREPLEMLLGGSEEFARRAMERAREQFREFASGRLNTRTRDVRSTVSGLESEVRLHQQALVDSTTRLREEKITLDTLLAIERGEATGIDPDAEWEAVERHAMVDSFTIRANRFNITTTPLTLTDPDTGESAPLGRVEISFPLQPGSGRGITIRNLDNAMDDGSGTPRPHPHCPGGQPCFGNIMGEVARMSAAGEVGGLLEILLQYLQTFNPSDDYGRYAGLWFEGDIREEAEER